MAEPRALIFDLDGTLVDSVNAICEIGNALLADLNLPLMEVAEARQYIGKGVPNFVNQALGARDVPMTAAHVARMEEAYATSDGSGNPPFAGVESFLKLCEARGLPLGLCTNKPAAPTHTVLNYLNWTSKFTAIVGGDTCSVRKPDPEPLIHCAQQMGVALEHLVYIGDSEVDAETAARAGVRFALYTEGYRKTDISALPHDLAFDHYDQLAASLFP